MKLNIIIEVKDSEERYVAENKFSPLKFVVVQSGKEHRICICQKGNLKPEYRLCASMNSLEFRQSVVLVVSLAKLQLSSSKLSAFFWKYLATLF